MARDFKIELDNVEMINGSDDLLKDTKVTKVTITGESKLNSLNSTFENCTELTAIEGDINLDGVSDMTEMTLNTPLDELKVTNPTEENIQADNSLNQVTNVKIGGTKYSKGGVQDVVGSLEWNAENFAYEDAILDNVYTNSSSIEDSKSLTVSNTLEQKATSIEITGQTYENLVDGKATKNLLDEMSIQQTEGKPTQFTPHMEQPICLEYIEGQTYQNLIKGKGEYKLTDTFSTTLTESKNSIENPPYAIEIPEIFGNTVQGYTNLITNQQLADSVNSVTWVNAFEGTNPLVTVSPNGFKFNNYGKINDDDSILLDITNSPNAKPIKLKAYTTYSLALKENSHNAFNVYSRNSRLGGQVFTTDSTGEIFITGVSLNFIFTNIVLIEGNDPYLIFKAKWFNLNYIQSLGYLYVDEIGEPILDEDDNEQYKLDIISHGYSTDTLMCRTVIQNMHLHGSYVKVNVASGEAIKGYLHCIAKIDFSRAKSGYFCTFVQGGDNGIKYYSTDHSLKFRYKNNDNEYFLGYVNHNEPFSITIKQTKEDKSLCIYFNGIKKLNITATTLLFNHVDFVSFNSYYHTGYGGGCDGIDVIYAQCSKNYGDYVGIDENDWDNINKWNKTTILMPQQLKGLDSVKDKLFYDYTKNIYVIENNIGDFNNINDLSEAILPNPRIIETKILEKPSLETYSPKTYITTSTDVQPSQMTVTNKVVKFSSLSLQPNKSYTVQLDSIGKDNKPITVNLGGATTTIQPTNNTKKHHRVSITTPSSLTTDNLDLSGEGVVVNDVMLFEGNTSAIKQDVDYMDGIQSIGEPFESRNLFDYTQSEVGLLDHTNGVISDYETWKYSTEFIPVNPNTTYCISQTSGSVFNYNVVEYNSSKVYLKGTNWTESIGTEINRTYNTFTTSANTYYLLLGWEVSTFEIQLEEGTLPTEFIAFDTAKYKLEIQTSDKNWETLKFTQNEFYLPQPLRKVGNVKDKFYWDYDKGHYCIEQNISDTLQVLETPKIIDLPEMNKKFSFNTYLPNTYVDVTNLPLQPYKLLLEDDTIRYKATLEPSTLYTIQFNCVSKLTTRLTLDLGGSRKTVDPIIGVNHVQITTPSELTSDRLFLIGTGIVIKEIIVNKGNMNQYTKYFDGEQSVGELQDDGTYNITIHTDDYSNRWEEL